MSINQFLLKSRATYVNSDLRFRFLFVGGVIAPLLVLMIVGRDISGPIRLEAFLGFLTIAALLPLSLSPGLLRSKACLYKTR